VAAARVIRRRGQRASAAAGAGAPERPATVAGLGGTGFIGKRLVRALSWPGTVCACCRAAQVARQFGQRPGCRGGRSALDVGAVGRALQGIGSSKFAGRWPALAGQPITTSVDARVGQAAPPA
jgi:hypothetical protein